MLKRNFAILIILGFFSSCGLQEAQSEVEFTGVIGEMGITSYQYGTHIITDGTQRYALRSEDVDLNDYEGEEVTVYGDLLAGYPIEGGPEFLLVKRVDD